MANKKMVLSNTLVVGAAVLIFWGLYRYFFKLPEEVEELLIKPLIWLAPVFYFLRQEKVGLKSIGLTTKNLIPSVYFAVALGFVFGIEGVVVNFIKYNSFNFTANIGGKTFIAALVLSLATAFTEEITFRGYLFNRLWQKTKKEWLANIITSLLWGLIHLPIAIFWLKLTPFAIFVYMALIVIFGIGSAFVFARTKNLFSSILLHVLWQWPIILFR